MKCHTLNNFLSPCTWENDWKEHEESSFEVNKIHHRWHHQQFRRAKRRKSKKFATLQIFALCLHKKKLFRFIFAGFWFSFSLIFVFFYCECELWTLISFWGTKMLTILIVVHENVREFEEKIFWWRLGEFLKMKNI